MCIVSDEKVLLAVCPTCGGQRRPIQSPPCWAAPPAGISPQRHLKANDVIAKIPWGGAVDIKQIFAVLLFPLIKNYISTLGMVIPASCLTSVVVRCRGFWQSCTVVDAVSKNLSPLVWQLCLFSFASFYLPAICFHDGKWSCPSTHSSLNGSWQKNSNKVFFFYTFFMQMCKEVNLIDCCVVSRQCFPKGNCIFWTSINP